MKKHCLSLILNCVVQLYPRCRIICVQLTFSFKRKSLEDVIIARCASICRRAGRVMSNIIETRQRKLKGENCTNLRPHHQNLTTDETTLETHNIDRRNKK